MKYLAILSLTILTNAANADTIYFAEIAPDFSAGFVSRVETDGSGFTQIVPVGGGIRAVGFDPVESKVYFTDVDSFRIARADADGQNVQDLITSGLTFPSAIVIEPLSRQMYFIDQDVSLSRADLDGSNLFPISETITYRGVDIDRVNNKVYWSTSNTAATGRIRRADLDGGAAQIAVQSGDPFFRPGAVAVDGAGGKIYWSDSVVNVIRRCNLDGTEVEIIWNGDDVVSPRGLALDLVNRKLYFGRDFNSPTGIEGSIWRTELDGSNPEGVLFGVGLVNYLVISADCAGDYNRDGTLDFFDYLDFVSDFSNLNTSADFNRDGVIDFFDYLDFVLAFNQGC